MSALCLFDAPSNGVCDSLAVDYEAKADEYVLVLVNCLRRRCAWRLSQPMRHGAKQQRQNVFAKSLRWGLWESIRHVAQVSKIAMRRSGKGVELGMA